MADDLWETHADWWRLVPTSSSRRLRRPTGWRRSNRARAGARLAALDCEIRS